MQTPHTPATIVRLTGIHPAINTATHQAQIFLFKGTVPMSAALSLINWVKEVAKAATPRLTNPPLTDVPWEAQATAAWEVTSREHGPLTLAQELVIAELSAQCGLNQGLVTTAILRLAKIAALTAWYIQFDLADTLPREIDLP